jgi:hypothetical protein
LPQKGRHDSKSLPKAINIFAFRVWNFSQIILSLMLQNSNTNILKERMIYVLSAGIRKF